MIERLSRLWGCSTDQAEHTIRSNEKHAGLVVSRRAFFGASAVALAAPISLVSVPTPLDIYVMPWTLRMDYRSAYPVQLSEYALREARLTMHIAMNAIYGKLGNPNSPYIVPPGFEVERA